MNYRLKSIIFAFLGLLTPFAYSAQMGANSAHKRAQQALAWLQRAQVPKTKNITVLAKPQQTANAQQKLAEIPEESAVDKDTEKQIDDLIDVLTMPNIAEYARKGDWTTVKNLIKAGRNVNDKDYDEGWTALMAAARKGNLTVVQELIKAGADVNARNDRESVALMFAAGYGHLYVVKALIQAGADVNAENQFVDTALTVACSVTTSLKIIKELIKNGADIKTININGNTALMLAQKVGHKHIVEYLQKLQQQQAQSTVIKSKL